MSDFEVEIEGPDLAEYQKQILYCPQRYTITEASTKVGKTFSHSWWLFERAHMPFNEVGFNHWWVAPIFSQAKIAFKRMKNLLPQEGYRVNESELSITTPLGTVMMFKSADNPDSLYGEDVYSCVFDEAPRASVDAFYAIRSTLTATRAPLKMIGNFGGSANWMHQLKLKTIEDPDNWAYFRITAYDAVREGILSLEEVEQAQKDLPPKIFKQLYLAEEQESDDMLVSFDNINDLWTNTHAPRGRKFITADIALQGSDKFVVLVWDGWTIIDSRVFAKCEADEVTEIIKHLAEKHSVPRSQIAYDADGLGSYLRGYLRGAKPFNNGASPITLVKSAKKSNEMKLNYKNLKSQCGYGLAQVIRQAKLYIEDNKLEQQPIKQELEQLQSHALDREGKIQLKPKSLVKVDLGRSPDYLDAMLIRYVFELVATPKKAKATIA
jgi:hypothetical protein